MELNLTLPQGSGCKTECTGRGCGGVPTSAAPASRPVTRRWCRRFRREDHRRFPEISAVGAALPPIHSIFIKRLK